MSALDVVKKRVEGAESPTVEDLPQHPGLVRGWKLNRAMADRLCLPGPGDLAELHGHSWAGWLASRVGRVLRMATTGNRSDLRDALIDLAVLTILWADVLERRGL